MITTRLQQTFSHYKMINSEFLYGQVQVTTRMIWLWPRFMLSLTIQANNHSLKFILIYRLQEMSVGEPFGVFHSAVNHFLQIMALLISNISLQEYYSESYHE